MVAAATFGVGQIVYTLGWIFAFFVQVWLMASVFVDVFRSDDLRGRAKAGWVVLTIVVPIIGILAYLIARGDKMRVHHIQAAEEAHADYDEYLRHFGGLPRSKADEIAKLVELRDHGDITAEEFTLLKAEVMSREPMPRAVDQGR